MKYLIEEKGAVFKPFGNTLLTLACNAGKLEILKYLIDHKEIAVEEATSISRKTLLHLASERDHFDIVQYLVEEKEADFQAETKDGKTPLHFVCESGHLDILKYLIEVKGAIFKPFINTLLTLAYRHLDVIKYLVEEKGASLDVVDSSGKTLLHSACKIADLDVVKYFLKLKKLNPNLTDLKCRTPLHSLSLGYNYLWDDHLVSYVKIAKLLINHGADLSLKDNDGKLAVDYLDNKLKHSNESDFFIMVRILSGENVEELYQDDTESSQSSDEEESNFSWSNYCMLK